MRSAVPASCDDSRLQIRTASAADAARLAEFARRVFSDAFASDNRPEDMAIYLEQAFGHAQQRSELDNPAMRTLIGETDGRWAAYAQLRQRTAPAYVSGQRPVEVSRFYVDREWHGRGVAAAVLAAVIETAKAMGADTLWLGVWERNARAIAFYAKHGFLRVGEQTFVLGTDVQTDWVMARAISATPVTQPRLHIRPAQTHDAPAMWRIIGPIIRAGETYALDRNMSEADALAYWMGNDRDTFVAEEDGEIVGTYYLRANQAGGGRHICNCGYMTSAAAAGRGVGRAMCLHSVEQARQRGYRGMQFNFVVSSNTRAVALWQSLGFEVVGRLPHAFEHPSLGCVDALVMFRPL